MGKLNKCYCCNKEGGELKEVKGRLLCEDCHLLILNSVEFIKNKKYKI